MSPSRVCIPDTEVHPLRAEAIGDDLELWIATPQPGFVPTDEKPRVLYLLDAHLFFGMAVECTRLMHRLYGELPPYLVVGLAYPTEDGRRQAMLRTRDFTSVDDPGFAAMQASFPLPPGTEPVEPAMGGADAFLSCLREQVVPFVRERFDVAPEGSAIFGSSMGGLFVTHALHEAPGLFDAYLAVSPALWWGGAELLDRTATVPDGGAPRVWLGAGGLEEAEHIPMLARFRLISNARTLRERLVADGFPVETTTFEEIVGESHTSVVPVALTRGLRAL